MYNDDANQKAYDEEIEAFTKSKKRIANKSYKFSVKKES